MVLTVMHWPSLWLTRAPRPAQSRTSGRGPGRCSGTRPQLRRNVSMTPQQCERTQCSHPKDLSSTSMPLQGMQSTAVSTKGFSSLCLKEETIPSYTLQAMLITSGLTDLTCKSLFRVAAARGMAVSMQLLATMRQCSAHVICTSSFRGRAGETMAAIIQGEVDTPSVSLLYMVSSRNGLSCCDS